jgi:hypothetical protein
MTALLGIPVLGESFGDRLNRDHRDLGRRVPSQMINSVRSFAPRVCLLAVGQAEMFFDLI